jgi:hypothetical protein
MRGHVIWGRDEQCGRGALMRSLNLHGGDSDAIPSYSPLAAELIPALDAAVAQVRNAIWDVYDD